MRTASAFLLTWSCLLATVAAAAEERFDPAARAKRIAPFVDGQTFAVVRIDVRRVAVGPLFAKLTELLPQHKEDLAEGQKHVAAGLEGLRRAGGTEVYLVFTLSLAPPRGLVFLVVPLAPGADEKALLAALPGQRGGGPHRRVGDVLLLADHQEDLDLVATLKPDPRPELPAAFEAAGDTAAQLLLLPPAYTRRVIEETMPELPKEIGGGPSTLLTRGALWAAAGIDLPPKTSVRLVVQSQDAQAAAALVAKWADVLRQLGQHKEVQAFVPKFDQLAKVLVPKAEGDRIRLAISDENQGVAAVWGALTPPFGKLREDARRRQSTNHLKQIALAMHNYHDGYKCFPAAASYAPDGKPLLSWRVHILPYLEQTKLYEQFRLNEPWDSPHNRALIEKMPPVYRSAGFRIKEKGLTTYLAPVAKETVFPPGGKGVEIRDISDGTSNTIMIVEADDQHAVVWTRPDDLAVDRKDPAKGLGGTYAGGFLAAFCDGSVRFMAATLPREHVWAFLTRSGGEPTP